ncbi:hypothetical protein [Oceanospirillum sp.]|uniref:hypothetical protein n=1 Tax=Oceanospirillum sp. TaxID=2021254 RepID=UPI003A8E7E6B
MEDHTMIRACNEKISTVDTPYAHAIFFDYADYLELLDWAGRCQREDKHSFTPELFCPLCNA